MRIVHNIIVFCTTMFLCLACSLKEDIFEPQTNDGVLQINAAVADFSELNVATKASAESDINELTMFVFTEDEVIVGGPVNIKGSNPTFLISTKDDANNDPYIWNPNASGDDQYIKITNGDDNLHKCDIYMVANSWHILEGMEITTLDDLKKVAIPGPDSVIGIPEEGFPMIGKQAEGTFDLANTKLQGSNSSTTLATITMKKLYAKVNFRFRLIADQVVSTPTFTLTSWQVFNVPKQVALGEPSTDTSDDQSVEYIDQPAASNILTVGDRTIEHTVSGTDVFEFAFYMPEHYLYADKTITYPDGMPDENKQRYKPLLCSDDLHPTYVKVVGSYKDHQGNAKGVTYNIYLGQDAVSDFCVKRNQLLNNIITIKGITDSNPYFNEDGELSYPDDYKTENDHVSIDHRVEIGSEGFVISLEREAVMDSHFEVRPMDIVVSDGAKIVVTIDDDSNTDPEKKVWMRFEESKTSDDHIENVGVRKYFTTNLVTETLLANNTLEIEDDTRLWLYFDENTNVYDSFLDTDEINPLPKWRDIKLKVAYYAPGNETTNPNKQMVYTFRQWHLWRIRDKDNTRYYDIEHEEEYLYNYASDDNYGKTTDGMKWGLEGITFSGNMGDELKTKAITARSGGGWASSTVNNIIDNLPSYYDFYLPREAEKISTDIVKPLNQFAGRRFSNGIIDSDPDGATGEYVSISLIKRELNDSPESAIEYCLNKNLRNTSGLIDDRSWYLPAIDEMEQIMVGGYSEFDVFQDKFYWSSQPAFHKNHFLYNTNWFASLVGGSNSDVWCDYYIENSQSARATSALLSGVDEDGNPIYEYAGSGVDPNIPHVEDSYYQSLVVSYDNTDALPTEVPNAGQTLEYWEGEKSFGVFPVTKTMQIYKVSYDIGYDSRSTQINRVRCVYSSGLVSDL